MREAVDLFLPEATNKGIHLSYTIMEDVPAYIFSDSSRLRQVLVNLIGNALKFTDQGAIRVEVKRASAYDMEGFLEFSIADTGIGIAADKLHRLFQSFSQVHPVINRKYGGTGLGLAICKKIVEMLGGSIWVDSTEGTGSTFRFTLLSQARGPNTSEPDRELDAEIAAGLELMNSSEDHLTAAEDEAGNSSEYSILIAEDHPVNCQAFVQMLGDLGYVPDVAHNGMEVIEALTEKKYDFVFLDIEMPVMDGIKTARLLRQLLPIERLPVIIGVSSCGETESRERCLASGMNAIINKPLREPEICQVLDAWSAELQVRDSISKL